MPAVSTLTNEWAGDGIEMSAPVLRRIKAHLEKGEDIRIRAVLGGVMRYARVSQGKEEHGRTLPDGVVLSVAVSESVSEAERRLNPLIHLVQQHEAVFGSRTGFVHSSLPTIQAVQYVESEIGKDDLTLPQLDEDVSTKNPASTSLPPTTPAPVSSVVEHPSSMGDSAVAEGWSNTWKNWTAWIYSWIFDARHAPVLVVLEKGLTATISNPLLHKGRPL